MSYDRLVPTISPKARKNCLVPVTWVKIIGGGAVPLSDGLETRPCKILDPRLGWVFLEVVSSLKDASLI